MFSTVAFTLLVCATMSRGVVLLWANTAATPSETRIVRSFFFMAFAFQVRRTAGLFCFLRGFVFELLSADRRLDHQALLRQREHHHAVLVLRGLRRTFGGRDRADVGAHLKLAGLEILERMRRLEENHLRERLSAGLRADARLRQRRLPDH